MDIAGPSNALVNIWEKASLGALNFSVESDGHVVFDAAQGFRISVDMIELGGGCINRLHATEPFLGSSVASLSTLLVLRAETVVNRGKDGDILDFEWLLSMVVKEESFPEIDNEELDHLLEAAKICLGHSACWVIAAIIGIRNSHAASLLLSLEPNATY